MTATSTIIEKYFISTIEASQALYDKNLIGHLLVIIYSTIDTLGLLDAPIHQTAATGDSFKSWVTKYLLTNRSFEFNATDLWAARCGLLHSFTSDSNLARTGQVRQLQYYQGDDTCESAIQLETLAKSIDNGRHLMVNVENFYMGFLDSVAQFAVELELKCHKSEVHKKRLRSIFLQHSL